MGRAAEWISSDRGNEAEADLVRIVFKSARPEKNSPKIDLVKLSVVDDDKVDADVVMSLKDFDVRRLVVDVVNKKDVKKVENIFSSNGFRILESDQTKLTYSDSN